MECFYSVLFDDREAIVSESFPGLGGTGVVSMAVSSIIQMFATTGLQDSPSHNRVFACR